MIGYDEETRTWNWNVHINDLGKHDPPPPWPTPAHTQLHFAKWWTDGATTVWIERERRQMRAYRWRLVISKASQPTFLHQCLRNPRERRTRERAFQQTCCLTFQASKWNFNLKAGNTKKVRALKQTKKAYMGEEEKVVGFAFVQEGRGKWQGLFRRLGRRLNSGLERYYVLSPWIWSW